MTESYTMNRICVFCGSSSGNKPEYLQAAEKLGSLMAESRIELVYGGGNVGLMGMTAKSCLENGGRVTGVIPEHLFKMEVAHKKLTDLKIVKDMHQRKSMMSEMADGFIALPGGIGTFEEVFEIFTWMQLGIHQKPVGILNINGFYDLLGQFMQHVVEEGFLRKEHLEMLIVEDDPFKMIERLRNYKHKKIEKWFDVEKHRVL